MLIASLTLAIMLSGLPGAVANASAAEYPEFIEWTGTRTALVHPAGDLMLTLTINGYEVKHYRGTGHLIQPGGGDEDTVVFSRKGLVTYALTGEALSLFGYDDEQEYFKGTGFKCGQDLTGDGIPDVVIALRWGQYFKSLFAYSLGKSIRKLGVIDCFPCGSVHVNRIGVAGDRAILLIIRDGTFAYWHYAAMETRGYGPEIALRYRDGAFQFSNALIKATAPTLQQLQGMSDSFHSGTEYYWATKDNREGHPLPPPKLFLKMLDLIYQGHGDSAKKLFDLTWPRNYPGKDLFLREFLERLSASPYWKDVRSLNGKKLGWAVNIQ